MKRGKFEAQPVAKKNTGKKLVSLVLVLVLLLGTVIGTTLAWLVASTSTIENTFTIGEIQLELVEPAGEAASYSFKMTPGASYTKDPKVKVKAGSEDCWLFVKVEVEDNGNALEYSVRTGDGEWTAVGGSATGVYYKKITEDSQKDVYYEILTDNTVRIKNSFDGKTGASMKFTAYAIQSDALNTEDAAVAWGYLDGQLNPAQG